MSISWTAARNQLIYIVPISHLKTGIQGPINIIISLKRKNYVIITNIRLIINYRRHCAQCKSPAFNLLRGRFWGPLLHAKFHPHRCNDKGVGPQKLKFLLRFDQNVEYKRPAGAYPLHDFHKICRVCTPFQDVLGVKISLDLLKGLWSYGSFKLRGTGYPQIFSPH